MLDLTDYVQDFCLPPFRSWAGHAPWDLVAEAPGRVVGLLATLAPHEYRIGGRLVATGRDKFGALIGDGSRLGANAVLAPGALLVPGTVIGRAALYDAEVEDGRA